MASATIYIKRYLHQIWSSLPSTSIAADIYADVGFTSKEDEIRGLCISEDFSGTIAAGSTITDAQLYLYCGSYVGDREGTWYIYRVRAHGGEPDATPYYYTDYNDTALYNVSWNSRHNQSGSLIDWTTAGATSTADDIDTSATGASEDNPITPNPVASSWWVNEVTGAMQQALDNCGGIIAFRISAVMIGLEEAEASYALLGHKVWDTEKAYIDVTYTPPAYVKKISGVSWASVKQVTGVAEASISKVSGVTAN